MGGGDKASRREAQRAREAEEMRERRIKSGTSSIRMQFADAFNDDYYKGIEKAANDFYKPQVENQYADALTQLKTALARSGLSNSTVRSMKEADAKDQYNLGLQSIAEQAKTAISQRKQNVANAESMALGQLQASADPVAAAAQTANLIDVNTAQPGFSPLGQVFTDVTAGLATQSQLEQAGNARYNMGVSNWGNNLKRYMQNVGT